jgi:chromosome segregation ATPase
MTTVTESDIKELKDLILSFREDVNRRFEQIDSRFNEVKSELNGIDKRLTVIENRLEDWKPSMSKIPDLAEKVGELKNWKQIGLVFVTAVISSIFSGTIGGVIGWLIRNGKY